MSLSTFNQEHTKAQKAQGKKRKKLGGRKKGTLNKKTQAILDLSTRAIEAGVLPLEVMLDNMRYYHGQAQELLMKILADVDQGSLDQEEAVELVEAFKMLGSFRMKSQACAVDAAPFLHAKLSNVTVKGDEDNPLTIKEQEDAFKTIEGTLAKVIASTASGDAGESELDKSRPSKSVDSAGEKPENGAAVVQMVNARWSRLRKNASRG